MVREFKTIISDVMDSQEFSSFKKEHPTYSLAHGFCQLDTDNNEQKTWQLGLYCPDNDQLAVFNTEPISFTGFEKAFKSDKSTITPLSNTDTLISTENALSTVKNDIKATYPSEVIRTVLVIVQVKNDNPVYAITAITDAFSMLIYNIDAITGNVISSKKDSVLNLQKENIPGEKDSSA